MTLKKHKNRSWVKADFPHFLDAKENWRNTKTSALPNRLKLLSSFQKHMQKLFKKLAFEWLIAHRQIYPRLFINDGLIVRKGVEARLAVIRAHAALADAAKAHFAGGQMDDHVIDTAATVGQLGGDPTDPLFVV